MSCWAAGGTEGNEEDAEEEDEEEGKAVAPRIVADITLLPHFYRVMDSLHFMKRSQGKVNKPQNKVNNKKELLSPSLIDTQVYTDEYLKWKAEDVLNFN